MTGQAANCPPISSMDSKDFSSFIAEDVRQLINRNARKAVTKLVYSKAAKSSPMVQVLRTLRELVSVNSWDEGRFYDVLSRRILLMISTYCFFLACFRSSVE
jgi:hypothetical protein